MDLDLAQVRAFVAVAEWRHFRRAAEGLALTQQGLSKRIARLEGELGARLFDREPGGVELTEAGGAFLEPARAALAAGERAVAAVAAARAGAGPVRLDVWGHLFEPLRTVRVALAATAGVQVEVGSGRDLDGVAAALVRGEAEAGFGRYRAPAGGMTAAGTATMPGTAGTAIAHRLVRLEPVDVLFGADHPLAGRDAVRPDELAGLPLLFPAAAERLDFLREFAERFGAVPVPGEANLGLEHLVERVRATPGGFTLLPAELPYRAEARAGRPTVVVRPLVEPTPLYAWSLIWRTAEPAGSGPAGLRGPTGQRETAALVAGFAAAGRERRWLEYRPDRDWLPAADLAELLDS
ncbi:LysR family transcriptional regulator [Kitasatospora sp. MMS16-BH015]|nr:LysR family transcriptional regulator [Kitasatospora sp. MMS16-BH015]